MQTTPRVPLLFESTMDVYTMRKANVSCQMCQDYIEYPPTHEHTSTHIPLLAGKATMNTLIHAPFDVL